MMLPSKRIASLSHRALALYHVDITAHAQRGSRSVVGYIGIIQVRLRIALDQ